VRTDRFIGNVASASLHAIIDGNLTHRAQGFVVESRNAQCGAKFLVEAAKILQVDSQGGQLDAFVSQQKFLVTGVPQSRELTLDHDSGHDGELKARIGALAKLRAAAVFLDAHDSAGTPDGKAQGVQTFDGFGIKSFFNIPHGIKVKERARVCKVDADREQDDSKRATTT